MFIRIFNLKIGVVAFNTIKFDKIYVEILNFDDFSCWN